jgi:hypothetical protein
MNFIKHLMLIAIVAALQLSAYAQGVIGGNQNGLGHGGYLPKPPGGQLPVAAR